MKAVVLVGGEGTRLRPLTFATPKSLLPIGNQPHLERQLVWLASHGVTEVVLSMGYLPDAFRARFAGDRLGDVTLRYAVEGEPLGTAGAIRFAADGVDERFVVCNGDILTELDLGAMVRFHDARGAEATISLTQVDDPTAFGVVPTQPDGRVIAFVEKPPRGKAPSNWINAGTYVLEPAFLDRVPPRLEVSVERETFPRMLEQPARLYGYRSDEYWIDIGTAEKYVQVHLDLLGGRAARVPVPGAAERSPGVWVQGDVTLEPGAHVEPPVLLGSGVRVESAARVHASVLGAGVMVESGSELERAVVHAGARVCHGSVVRDSVVGADAVLKPEVVVSDFTLIGARATIASGTHISAGRVPVDGG